MLSIGKMLFQLIIGNKKISKIIVNKLFALTGKKIVILGFNANTNDTRESPAIAIAKDLLEEGAKHNS